MVRILFVIAIMFFMIGANSTESEHRLKLDGLEKDFECKVVKHADKYSFIFSSDALNTDDTYIVNKRYVGLDEFEYSWIVYMENSENKYEFGFYYIKNEMPQQKYSFDDLLRNGQKSLFKEVNGIPLSDPIVDEYINVKIKEEGLIISFNQSEIPALNVRDYKIASFWVLSAGKKPLKCSVNIP